MTEEYIIAIVTEAVDKAVKPAIETHVNGVVREIGKRLDDHALEDKKFQDRMEPLIQVFEKNNIVKVEFKNWTGTLSFYAKNLTIVGAFIAGAYWFIKSVVMRLP